MQNSCALQNKTWTFKTERDIFLNIRYLPLLVHDCEVVPHLDNAMFNLHLHRERQRLEMHFHERF